MKKPYLIILSVLSCAGLKAQVFNDAFVIQSANNDKGMRITVDISGNVVTTGSFGATADFDPGAGTASLTPAGSFDDVYVAKYDASLNYLWAIKFGTSGSDYPYALATDGAGNIFVAGDVSTNDRDGFLNKYDGNGNLLWSITLGAANKDVVYGIATDADDNIYATGYFESTVDFDPGTSTFNLTSAGGRDIFLAKYDSFGNFKWAFNMGGSLSVAYEEAGQDMAISGSNIYLTGNFEGTTDFDPGVGSQMLSSNGSLDIFIAKYDTAGNFLLALNAGSANKHDYSYGIDLDASENIYITGGFEETVDFDPSSGTAVLTSASVMAQDIYIAKYSASGSYQWVLGVGGSTSVDDHAFDIDVTPAGDIYICGEVWGPADFDPSSGVFNINTSNDQIFLAKYTSAGEFTWAFEIGSVSGNGPADNGYGVKAANSSLFVTGDFTGTADFDPGPGTATLGVNNQGHVFVASYDTTALVSIAAVELKNHLKVFPNPAVGNVTISWAVNKKWSLKITDYTGKVVFKADNIQTESIGVNMSEFSKGLYFFIIQSDNIVLNEKLVLQ